MSISGYSSEDVLAASRDVACQLEEHGSLAPVAARYGINLDILDESARFASDLCLGPRSLTGEEPGMPRWLRLGLEDIWCLTVLVGLRLRFGQKPSYEIDLDPRFLRRAIVGIYEELEAGDLDSEHIRVAEQIRHDVLAGLHERLWELLLHADSVAAEHAKDCFMLLFDHALVVSMFV